MITANDFLKMIEEGKEEKKNQHEKEAEKHLKKIEEALIEAAKQGKDHCVVSLKTVNSDILDILKKNLSANGFSYRAFGAMAFGDNRYDCKIRVSAREQDGTKQPRKRYQVRDSLPSSPFGWYCYYIW